MERELEKVAAVWTLGVRMLGRAEGLHFHCREENAVNCKSFWASLSSLPSFLIVSSLFSIYTNNILWFEAHLQPFSLHNLLHSVFSVSLSTALSSVCIMMMFFSSCSPAWACLLPPLNSPPDSKPHTSLILRLKHEDGELQRECFFLLMRTSPTQPLSRHFNLPDLLSFSLSLFPSVFVSFLSFVCETSVTSLCSSIFHTCKSTVSVQWYYHREQAWYFVVYGTIVHVFCVFINVLLIIAIHPSIHLYIYIHSLATLLGYILLVPGWTPFCLQNLL